MNDQWKIDSFGNPDVDVASLIKWYKQERRLTRQKAIPEKAFELAIQLIHKESSGNFGEWDLKQKAAHVESLIIVAKHSTDGLWAAALRNDDDNILSAIFEQLMQPAEYFLPAVVGTREYRNDSIAAIENNLRSLINSIKVCELRTLGGELYENSLTVNALIRHSDHLAKFTTKEKTPFAPCFMPAEYPTADEVNVSKQPFEILCDVKLIELLAYAEARVSHYREVEEEVRGERRTRLKNDKFSDAREGFIDAIVHEFYRFSAAAPANFPRKDIVDTVDAILSAKWPDLVPANLPNYKAVCKASIARVAKYG